MDRTIFLCLLMLFMICGCSGSGNENPPKLDEDILNTNRLLQYFITKNPGKEVIKYGLKDLNNDGREDLLIIYKVSKGKNMMCVILDLGKKYDVTNELPAPVSNQVIHFKDIDDKPPKEFIIHGSKGAKVGYAIFRIEKGQIVDLFGEGMDGCC